MQKYVVQIYEHYTGKETTINGKKHDAAARLHKKGGEILQDIGQVPKGKLLPTKQEGRSAKYCERKGLPLDRISMTWPLAFPSSAVLGSSKWPNTSLDKRNGVTDLVVNDIDRFARNYREYLDYVDRMFAAGITLHSVIDDEEYDYKLRGEVDRQGLSPDRKKANGSPEGPRKASEQPPNWVTTSDPCLGATCSSTRQRSWTNRVITPFAAS